MIFAETRTIFRHMALASRLVRHRSGVPMYQYPTGPDTPPVSVVRAGRDEVLERGRHIHDFPALWYVSSAGVVYVAAAGEVLDPSRVDRSGDGVGVFFDPVALGEDGESPWPAHRAHRAGVDHRTAHGREPPAAGRYRPVDPGGGASGRDSGSRLLLQAVPPDARHLPAQLARSARLITAASAERSP